MVYVISKSRKPLMPCENVIARLLLKNGKAKVKKKCPFAIQLTYDSTEYIQDVILGQDTGSKYIGTACIGNNKVLYQSQVELRDDIKSKMCDRRQIRKFRRSRKTRYRKVRFLNRKNSTKLNRLPPSIKSKINSHFKELEFCHKILPISKEVLEVAQFDIQLLQNPMLASEKVRHWGYQRGRLYGFENAKAYVLIRDNYTCQCCKTKRGTLHVHHIAYRSQGGSDDTDNLITLCENCHKKLHNGELKEFEVKLKGKKKTNLRYATQMSIVRSQLLKNRPKAIETFGYVTKANRQNLGIDKTHYIDACVIASQGNLFKQSDTIFFKKCVSRQDRQLTKGIRSEKKIPTNKILGFRKFDKVKYFGKDYFIKGRRSVGTCVLMNIFGQPIDFGYMPKGLKTPKLSNCQKIQARTSILVERRGAIPALS